MVRLRPAERKPVQRPFRRRRPPSRSATRLMLVALVSGILLVVVLALVFVPVALEYEGRPFIRVDLARSADDPYRVVVARVNQPFPLADFRVDLWNATDPAAPVPLPGLDLAEGTSSDGVRFLDADGSGTLTAGDAFEVTPVPGTAFDLRLYFKPLGIHVAGLRVP